MDFHTADHLEHAAQWQIPVPRRSHSRRSKGDDDDRACLACVVELLEDDDLLAVRKEHVLTEFLHMLQYAKEPMMGLLCSDGRVALHMVLVLLGLTSNDSEHVVATANEAAYQVLVGSESEELVFCTLEHIAQESVRMYNYKKCVPSLSLLGRLLHALPQLADALLQNFGSYVDYLCCGLTYPDSDVRTAVSYICVHLYTSRLALSLMPAQLHTTVTRGLLDVLKAAGEQELTINALGLLKVLLEDDKLTEYLMNQPADMDSMATVLKKLLLSNKELLQLATAQCLSELLQRGEQGHYTQVLLQADMAEFLFEVLNSTNEILISCVYRCLRLMAECRVFFDKCHAVYGIESLLRSLWQLQKQKNYDQLEQGLELMAVVLERHTGNIRLFSNLNLVRQSCSLLESAMNNQRSTSMTSTAARAFIAVIRKNQLPLPTPFSDLLPPLVTLAAQVGDAPALEPQSVKDKKHKEDCQMLILHFVEALNKSMQLVKSCVSDPVSSAKAYTAPDQTAAPSDEQTDKYLQELITHSFDSALPAVMANHEVLDSTRLYEQLFECLCLVYELYPPITEPFSQKLIQVNFIPFVLSAKVKLQGETSHAVLNADRILMLICSSLLCGDCSDVPVYLRSGITHIKGSPRDILCLLCQHAPAASTYQHVHQAAVLLIYLTARCSNCFIPGPLLSEALITYLSLHQLDKLPDNYIAQLVYLWCYSHGEQDSAPNIDAKLHTRLCAIKDVSDHDCLAVPHVVQWIFREENRAAGKMGVKMISLLMSSNEENHALMLKLSSSSTFCIRALLKVVVCGSETEVENATKILREILQSSAKEGSSDVVGFLYAALNDLLNTAFTDHHELPQDENLCALIQLNAAMLQCVEELPDTNIQLLYHLRELITRQKHSSKVQGAVITYLNIILTQQHIVAMVLLSDVDFLGWLRDSIMNPEHELCAVSYVTLALLLYQQNRKKLQVPHPISLPVQPLLSSLSVPSHELAVPSLLVWTQYLQSDRQLLHFMGKEKDRERELEKREIRLLYIYLQQCLIKENPLVQQLCASCIETLLQYVSTDERLVRHLYQHPWNRILLQTLCVQYDKNIPTWLASFLLLMVKNHPGNVDSSLRDVLAQQYQEAVQIKRMPQVASLYPLIQYLADQKLITTNAAVEKSLAQGQKMAGVGDKNNVDEVFFALILICMSTSSQ